MTTRAQALARVHRIMVDEPWGGYTQGGNRIGKTPAKPYDVYGRTVSIPAHDMDCSSSIALAIWVVFGTLPFTYTGDEYAGLTSHGWKAHKVDRHKCWDGYAPKAGDVVLRDGHTAMFQDAGQTISEFSANERHAATGGKAGDQTGWESKVTSYASTGKWNWVFECPAGEWTAGSSGKASTATTASAKVPAGTYRVLVDGLNVRTGPNLGYRSVARYDSGDTVLLDGYSEANSGWVWGRYTAASGKHRYIAVRSTDGRTVYARKAG